MNQNYTFFLCVRSAKNRIHFLVCRRILGISLCVPRDEKGWKSLLWRLAYYGNPVLISFLHTPFFSSPLTHFGPCVCFPWNVVLLGVVEKQLQNEVFPAEMERKLAQLLSEVSTRRRMWRRATIAAGNSVVQVGTQGGQRGREGERADWSPATFSCKWERQQEPSDVAGLLS